MTTIEFKREALYEEVWQTPITQLAERYGLSDNGLRKICVALNVPLPPRRFWAKRAAGKNPRQSALPPKADRHTFISQPVPAAPNFKTIDDDAWLQARLNFDASVDNAPSYEPSPTRWHPIIAAHRSELRKAAKDLDAARRANERWEKLPAHLRRSGIDDGWKWRMVADRGQALVDSQRPLPYRVSAGCYERALAISNALALAAKPRGFKVEDDDKRQRMLIVGHDAVVPWRINERLENQVRMRITYDGKEEPEKFVAPTGQLRITLEAHYGNTITFLDEPALPLESQIKNILAGLYKCVLRQRVKGRKDAAREERWAEEARQRARVEYERQQIEDRRKQEQQKREQLIAESKRWRDAQTIRNYIAQRRSSQSVGIGNPDEFEDWVAWAKSVADDLDPCTSKEKGGDSTPVDHGD